MRGHYAFLAWIEAIALSLALQGEQATAFIVPPRGQRIRRGLHLVRRATNNDNDDKSTASFMDVVYGAAQTVAKDTLGSFEISQGASEKIERFDALTGAAEETGDTIQNPPLLKWLHNIVYNEDEDASESNATDTGVLVKKFLAHTGGEDDSTMSSEFLDTVVNQARKEATSDDTADFQGILEILNTHIKQVKEALAEYLGDLTFENIGPASLFYYLQYESKIKNSEWKREAHQDFPKFDISAENENLIEMYALMKLSQAVYYDSREELLEGIAEISKTRYELIYDEDTETPNQPAHFIAIDRGDSCEDQGIVKVYLVIRGTKTLTDAITDLLCDTADYRGTKAHSGFVEAGTYLANQHTPLFEKLLNSTEAEKIDLTLVGHSLGAGAASIAAIEFNEVDGIQAHSVGFGCPPIVSLKLAEESRDYITNLIFDSDVVSRLSPATFVNGLLNLMEFDWTEAAKTDIHQLFKEFQKVSPDILSDYIVTDANIAKSMEAIDKKLQEEIKPTIKASSMDRVEKQLFVPGTCIHFYRNGDKIAGATCPNTFFGELDFNSEMLRDHFLRVGYDSLFAYVIEELEKEGHLDLQTKSDRKN